MSLGPVVMPLSCTNPDCTLPEGGVCARVTEFRDPMAACADLARLDPIALPSTEPDDIDLLVQQMTAGQDDRDALGSTGEPSGQAAPWAGRHLGARASDRLLWCSPARVLAVLGPRNAGKTSYLASLFLQLANGQCQTLPYRFAGSRTLHGTHEILDKIRAWDLAGQETDTDDDKGTRVQEIVAHTPKHSGFIHFLHLCLRPRNRHDNRAIDVLLSDVAGEWFSDHTSQRDDDMHAFFARCDGFLVMADVALLQDKRTSRRHDAEIARMIRRALADRERAPERACSLALVFGKYDLIVRSVLPPAVEDRHTRDRWGVLGERCPKIWAALEAARQVMPVSVCPVTSFPQRPTRGQPVGVDRPLAFVLKHADARARWPVRVPPVPDRASSFEAMRRWPPVESTASTERKRA